MSAVLETVGLAKSFLWNGQPRLILSDVSFRMEAGRFASVVGRSGCGKSTLLELLAGIIRPDRGKVLYRGEEITGKSGLLGYMPQDDLLFPWLSVAENALLPARVKRSDLKAARQEIARLLPVFGLEEHARHLPYQLSGGLRQRAAFLRTVMTGTDLLLLDEPFASLDAINRANMQDWLAEITRKLGLSVILVTHDIDEALILAEEVFVMRGEPGTIVTSVPNPQTGRLGEDARRTLKAEILGLVRNGGLAGR